MNSQQRLDRRFSTLNQHSPVTRETPRVNKLLVKVNIQGSLGPVHVVTWSETAVKELTKAAIGIYVKEMRRPILKETDPRRFELHYSSFSLDSLEEEEKLINLESRNFYLCLKPPLTVAAAANGSLSCSEETRNGLKSTFPLTRFMGFML